MLKVCPEQVDFIYNNLSIKTIENILNINNQLDKYLYSKSSDPNKPPELSKEEQIKFNNMANKYSTEIPKNILDKLK